MGETMKGSGRATEAPEVNAVPNAVQCSAICRATLPRAHLDRLGRVRLNSLPTRKRRASLSGDLRNACAQLPPTAWKPRKWLPHIPCHPLPSRTTALPRPYLWHLGLGPPRTAPNSVRLRFHHFAGAGWDGKLEMVPPMNKMDIGGTARSPHASHESYRSSSLVSNSPKQCNIGR